MREGLSKAAQNDDNAHPAYAKGFGVAGAHLSRRSPGQRGEGGTSNTQCDEG